FKGRFKNSRARCSSGPKNRAESKLNMADLENLKRIIEPAFEGKTSLESSETKAAIEGTITLLDRGEVRVAERKSQGQWETHEWVKKAILLYFRIRKMSVSQAGEMTYVDKIPLKKWDGKEGVRVVPPAVVRRGAFVQS